MDMMLVRPGDLVVRDDCPTWDADRPALVISCTVNGDLSVHADRYGPWPVYHVVLMYTGAPCVVSEVDLNPEQARDYRTLARARKR